MRLLIITSIIFSTCIGLFSCDSKTQNIYISPNGNDRSNGTIEKPFLTLERAKLEVRKLKKKSKEPINVYLRGGTYLLKKTVVFGVDDSGTKESPVTYRAYEDENPVFTSAIEIKEWEKVSDITNHPSRKDSFQIWSAELPKKNELPKYLFCQGIVLPRSMSKGFIPKVRYKTWQGDSLSNRNQLNFDEGIIQDWTKIQDMELVIMPSCDWTLYNLPLKSIDKSTNVVQTLISGSYALGAIQKGTWNRVKTAWIANCREGMNEEGNWFASKSENKVYLVHKGDVPPESVTVPMLKEYIRIEGTVGKDLKKDIPVKYLNFIGLSFVNGERDTWDETHHKNHIQHEWERYDNGDALFRFRGAEDCMVSGCQFLNSGGGAIRLDLYCQNIIIENNNIQRLGGCGIFLCGYGIGEKDLNKKNIIKNNHISHVGEAYWHSSAITVFQSGENIIANNRIHHTPYNGITITGPRGLSADDSESGVTALQPHFEGSSNWELRFKIIHTRRNIIENNELFNCVEIMGDGNAIYLSGCGENNIVRHNYIHDMIIPRAHAAGVRTDGVTRSVCLENNLFYNISSSAIVLKDINHATDNIMIDVDKNGGAGYLSVRGGPNTKSRILNNIFLETRNQNPRFIFGRQASWLTKINLEDATLENNVFYQENIDKSENIVGIYIQKEINGKLQTVPFLVSENEMKYEKFEGISVENDRPVIDISSSIFQNNHKVFDISKIGLTDEFNPSFLSFQEKMWQRAFFKN